MSGCQCESKGWGLTKSPLISYNLIVRDVTKYSRKTGSMRNVRRSKRISKSPFDVSTIDQLFITKIRCLNRRMCWMGSSRHKKGVGSQISSW